MNDGGARAPSMMGSRSRCTPSLLGSPVRNWERLLLTTLSISSMNTMLHA
jgi:hypothetical protein